MPSDKTKIPPENRALASEPAQHIDAAVLGDIDAWNVRQTDGWYFFTANLPGADGPRGYRRRIDGGHEIAETPGPILGVLSLGGARRAISYDAIGPYPYHVVSAADDIGPVGVAGLENAVRTDAAERVREQTQDTLLAAEILAWRKSLGRGLPLLFARTETDQAASIDDLSNGQAYDNFLSACDNLKASAAALGKTAKIAAISLDFCAEDISSSPDAFFSSFQKLIEQIDKALWDRDFSAPVFLVVAETSIPERVMGFWRLAVYGGPARIVVSMPDYALERNAYLRFTQNAMQLRARTEAAALSEIEAGDGWNCPTFLLAEWEGKKPVIRLRSNATLPLTLNATGVNETEDGAGFQVFADNAAVKVKSVQIDPEEPRDVLVRLPGNAPRKAVTISYGFAGDGAVRDTWTHPFYDEVFRWALPMKLKVTPDGI